MSLRRSFALLAFVSSPLMLANCAAEEVADDAASGTNSMAGTPSSGSSGAAGTTGGNAGKGGSSGSSGGGTGPSAGTAGTLAGASGSAGAGAAGTSGSAGAGGTTAGSGSSGAGAGGATAGGGSGGAGAGGAGAGGAGAGGAGGAGAGGTSGSAGATGGGGSGSGVFTLTSAKLTPDEEMAADFTCEGDSHSPPFEWTGVPAGTMSFAMLFVDTTIAGPMPDSAMAWHHAIWDIPADVTALPEDMPTTATVTTPVACKQFNPLTCDGYLGPCAQKEDTYEFRLYALPVATLTGTLNSVIAIRDAVMAADPLGEAILPVKANASGTLTCPK